MKILAYGHPSFESTYMEYLQYLTNVTYLLQQVFQIQEFLHKRKVHRFELELQS